MAANVRGDLDSRTMRQTYRGLDFRQLNYQWLVENAWRDNEEVHSKSAEEQVIGYEEDAEETHDEEKEDQEEEDVIPNFEIDDENGDDDVFDKCK